MDKSAVRYIQWYIFINHNWSLENIYHIVPINCHQKRIHVKFRDHSGQKAKLKLVVEHYLNNRVQINQDVSSNKNNLFNDIRYLLQLLSYKMKRNLVYKTSQAMDFWRYYGISELLIEL